MHRFFYRLSGGRIGGRVARLPVLELTTLGRRSGQPRSVLLNYLDDPDGFLVVASNAGDDRDPLWWLNLQSQPAATVAVASNQTAVRAEEVIGSEYQELWDRFGQLNPGYRDYALYTDRHITIVRLRTQNE
ncbi:MAG: nitroreductase/quinone reductase family protein [Acidimicrobiia bacterium]